MGWLFFGGGEGGESYNLKEAVHNLDAVETRLGFSAALIRTQSAESILFLFFPFCAQVPSP